MNLRSKPGSPNSMASPVPNAASDNSATNPNSKRCALRLRDLPSESSPGSSGANARHSIGSAGRMYMSRLPDGMLKNTNTSSTHASGNR